MQKDVHFYLTYALSRKAGISAGNAEKIAWANQYTDDSTKPDLHGIQTQSGIFGNWIDKQIQLSVLVPFHFIPGDDLAHSWKTTRNNQRAQKLVEMALKQSRPFELGIALHGFQDTFSHEGFSGWQEELNSCYSWYYIESRLPNVDHAELMVTPDVVHYVWTDPRDGRRVDNKLRTMSAAKATYDYLVRFSNTRGNPADWTRLKTALKPIFKLTSYDKRITKLCQLSGNNKINYKPVNKKLERTNKTNFIKAASNHLAAAMELFDDLPWAK